VPELGVVIPPDQPPERVLPTAVAAEAAGLDEVWLWEDCFAEAGIASAAAVLTATSRVRVGVGLLPVPLRNVALTAMEVATLARLFPGRFLPGVGHGVLDWMGQVGARAASPTTLLREYTDALRALLDGEEVSTDGRYVHLEGVQLRWPATPRPPVLVGARGPRTLALAGEAGDGVILDTDELAAVRSAVATVRKARAAAGRDGEPEVVVFASVPVATGAEELHRTVTALGEAGAHRVAVVGTGEGGAPEGGTGIAGLVEALGDVRRRLD
jgi:alkanesulfonate monooxygenase SsuD/methylene tetrahydromethanopterin reductase-like flavin-dependent oxidoreductase (luciferase family)